jgi:hypothetical protein
MEKKLSAFTSFLYCHCLILLPGFGVFARNITVCLWFMSVLLLLLYMLQFVKRFPFIRKWSIILIVLCSLGLFSPIDIAFIPQNRILKFVDILPIVCVDNGWYKPIRELTKEGKIKYVDYIAYYVYGTNLCYPKYAIVIRCYN